MPLNRRLTVPLAALVAGSAMASQAAAAEELNVYSARHYDSDEALYAAFTEQTGVEVNVLEGDSDQLIQRLKLEGEASPADVMITVDAGRLWRGEQEDIFASVDSEVLDERLPDYMRHPEGKWFGFSQRVRAIFIDPTEVNADEITSYEDLADPKFEGQVCIRSSNNIYNQSLLASLIAHHSEEEAEAWAKGVVDNFARDPEGGDTDQIRGVASGECNIALANHYYYVRLVNSDQEADREAAEKVEIVFPNQDGRGAHVNVGGAGMVKGAPNEENAVRFLEFLASDEAQALFATGNYEFPAVESAETDGVIASWADFKKDDLNVSVLGENNPEAIRIFDRVGWR
ncbi:Fe(3+) ABC transporter substrate-binding protein [Halomonas sp. LR5S13]|uniref:Fe(3+) ABC transporter substrate-binding protein n=1 Tax=Halomonas rhizosphaerae TaxID=3043296 RepID=UPI0024A98C32|nr:Fe(3+) ABC transporter substrate-binding protein [Halomonas rhizosphaerae]MDI5922649.1 Fe(3+) ABC transporter substrate-binding protein [Halomonas rhizosphaerae]